MTIKKMLAISMSIIILVSLSFLGAADTMAVWESSYKDENSAVEIIPPRNDNIKYIVFMPVKNGLHLDSEVADSADLDSFVAVGYTGLLDEITFPDEYTISLENTTITKPVTAIAAISAAQYKTLPLYMDGTLYEGGEEAHFRNNLYVKKIVIPAMVTEIASTIFSGCTELNTVIFNYSDTPINVGIMAFANCDKLTTVTQNGRVVSGEQTGLT
ncbi:MAG: leucine-rich repeat protein [Christensenellaceae bacterium]|jgi:hypothetical protein|nr:leucine-rich repeat protein [Christensenellaceae bacterium]